MSIRLRLATPAARADIAVDAAADSAPAPTPPSRAPSRGAGVGPAAKNGAQLFQSVDTHAVLSVLHNEQSTGLKQSSCQSDIDGIALP
eukprot:947999-Pleurochrysis_carterae.AAC.2